MLAYQGPGNDELRLKNKVTIMLETTKMKLNKQTKKSTRPESRNNRCHFMPTETGDKRRSYGPICCLSVDSLKT